VLLNKIWALQSLIGNHFYPQQKLVSKVRDGAKIAKKYDTAQTPHARAVIAHSEVKALPKRRLAKEHERSQRRREPAKHPPRAALANPTAHYVPFRRRNADRTHRSKASVSVGRSLADTR
jgi:hypothetical protein